MSTWDTEKFTGPSTQGVLDLRMVMSPPRRGAETTSSMVLMFAVGVRRHTPEILLPIAIWNLAAELFPVETAQPILARAPVMGKPVWDFNEFAIVTTAVYKMQLILRPWNNHWSGPPRMRGTQVSGPECGCAHIDGGTAHKGPMGLRAARVGSRGFWRCDRARVHRGAAHAHFPLALLVLI